jgi:hypothetical protein
MTKLARAMAADEDIAEAVPGTPGADDLVASGTTAR